ncbi:iron ABC transporter permease [Alkalibacter rhizosphaerae]|uniref:Iron ABC transporter permease n=1 Tax=Alkalibacter rhizosphaerae TaxID=2815577 RepID=A0A975AIM7_9FIRM|nr:iron ABC transporter permease [Alkalibacter rhizosphaerae]QSX08695.1 iron ABC transporter permease [Alkalibacter rhizosphaerae]
MTKGRNTKDQRAIGPTFIWWGVVLFLLFAVVYPSIRLIINSFIVGDGYGLQNYVTVFTDKTILRSMTNSFKVVLTSTFLSTVLGVFLAWAVVRTDVPGKKYWRRLLSIPYFIPPFIGAIAWTFLLGPVGYFNKAAMSIFNLSQPLFNVYSIGGMIFVMTMYRYAVSFIVVLPTMKKISASVEEAARISGASPWRTLRDITLPLITPSIVGAMLLTFMFILADFGVSSILGAPNRINLMTTQIYYLVNRTDMANNLQIASAYSLFLALFGLVGLWMYNRVLKTNKFVVVSGKSAAVEPTKLGKKTKVVLFSILALIFAVTTLAPIFATLTTSLTKIYGLPFGLENLTFRNFSQLLQIQNIKRAFTNSMFLAVTSGAVITITTLIVSYIAIRGGVKGVRGIRFMQTMVTLPYAVPGTIIALAMILSFSQPFPFLGFRLYNTIWILLVAYIARFMNLGYNNISGAISQIDPSLEEAARISGASHLRSFRDVMLPLLKSSLIGSFFLVVAPTLSEISLSSLLWSVSNETIGTIVYSAKEEGRILLTASIAIVMIILVMLINAVISTERETV